MNENDIKLLKHQLFLARSEIKNLRQQINGLQHIYQNDVQKINTAIQSFQCDGCKLKNQQQISTVNVNNGYHESTIENSVSFKPIGIIRSIFPEKRAVPRQASVASRLVSRIELDPTVFNNPEHSFEGLDKFSHIWIIYHFHRNQAHHKAKVAPPRLCGERVGVFSTRSPHRPCPIGLSLVQLEKIENSTVYFYGTDMVDETPVLDIKPYIPQYDVPFKFNEQFFSSREAPDGEENTEPTATTSGQCVSNATVPNWVTSEKELTVIFNKNATQQLQELAVDKIFTEIHRRHNEK
ncbi:putative S-adenosylmethionine-dependent methyltransferase RcsF isoform X2 [Sabethes cyaneus]|uniref:putative S-adenosylmethionine-dependent methyltransferase RcsF isoform X2 n=1 Tax=Sabethes cyaneus TaxID=53552 RepID=UPI00237D3930|nr:putative S-adenosylmethionine-dependent methyltransferase RcsF isoform X2 [Sabethes cyaneus]